MKFMQKKILTLLILGFILAAALVYGECIIPDNEMIISQDTIFCYVTYHLPAGIVINADGITLNCNNAVLQGYGFGEGIRILGVGNVIIENCIIKDYESGIYLKDSSNNVIKDNELIGNVNGVKLDNSAFNSIVNNKDESLKGPISFYDEDAQEATNNTEEEGIEEPDKEEIVNTISNEEEIIDITKDTNTADETNKQTENITEYVNKEIKTKENIQNIINRIDKEVIDKITAIRTKDHETASNSVDIKKTKIISTDAKSNNKGKTRFETSIRAKEDVNNLVIYEYIPKEIASDASEIRFYGKATIVENDPIIKKEIGSIKKDDVVVITYEVDKIIAGNTDPSSVVTIEGKTRWIDVLSGISYILAAYIALVIIKRYKADKMLSNLKKRSKKLLGVPLPVAYITLSIIPKINYSLLLSEDIAVIFYVMVIFLEAIIIKMLIKKK